MTIGRYADNEIRARGIRYGASALTGPKALSELKDHIYKIKRRREWCVERHVNPAKDEYLNDLYKKADRPTLIAYKWLKFSDRW